MNVICKLFGHDFTFDYYWLRDRSYNRSHDNQCVLLVHRCRRCGEVEFRPVNLDVSAWIPSIYDEDDTHHPDDGGEVYQPGSTQGVLIARGPR